MTDLVSVPHAGDKLPRVVGIREFLAKSRRWEAVHDIRCQAVQGGHAREAHTLMEVGRRAQAAWAGVALVEALTRTICQLLRSSTWVTARLNVSR